MPRKLTTCSAPSLPALPRNRACRLAEHGGLRCWDVQFTAEQAYPEGIAWSAAQSSFFVSSIHQGVIGKVDLNGHYTPFIRDDKLVSSVGLHFDSKRNLVWAAVGELGNSVRSTPATQGQIYVTDSFSPVIYRVVAQGKASVFVRGELFMGEGFNLDTQDRVLLPATTAAQVGNGYYVLNPRLDALMTKESPQVSDYLLQGQ